MLMLLNTYIIIDDMNMSMNINIYINDYDMKIECHIDIQSNIIGNINIKISNSNYNRYLIASI